MDNLLKEALQEIKGKTGFKFIGKAYKENNSILLIGAGERIAYLIDLIAHKIIEIELPNIMVNNIISHCETIVIR